MKKDADAILPFVYSAHKQLPSDLHSRRIHYEDYGAFNEYLDDTYGTIQLEGQEFLPSWTIYTADKDHRTYRELLLEYEQLIQEIEVVEEVSL